MTLHLIVLKKLNQLIVFEYFTSHHLFSVMQFQK